MHLSVGGHLGCFHPGCCKYCYSDLCGCLCLFESWFSQYICSSWIAGSYDSRIFCFQRNVYTVLHSGCRNFYSHPLFKRVHFSPAFIIGELFDTGHSDYCKVIIVIDLICIYAIISDAEHLFMCFLAICTSSLEICLYRSFARFFWLDCLIFFEYWASWTVWIFWKLIPCQSFQLQIFSSILSLVFLFCLWFHLLCTMKWFQKDIAAVHGIMFWLCFPPGVL